MREFEAKWIRHDEPVPEGWELAEREKYARDHHSHYGRMVVREVPADEEG
jgi:hypothetical protein